MLADIASGNRDASDVLLLIAAVLFVVAAALAWNARALWPVVTALGLGCLAIGFLVL